MATVTTNIKWETVIAIDGPSGSGKSTVAQKVATSLGLLYVNTGAMFRALGYAAHHAGIPLSDEKNVFAWLNSIDFRYGVSADCLVMVDDVNLTQKIKEHEVSSYASEISRIPSLRTYLLQVQRNLVRGRFCSMEGRDIGTVVFPHAFCKIFLTASPETRANRRYLELKGKGKSEGEGEGKNSSSNITKEKILQDIIARDNADSSRDTAPLKAAEEAIHLDSSPYTIDEVVAIICDKAKERADILGLKWD